MKKKILTLFVAVIISGTIFAQIDSCIADFDYYPVNTLEYHFYANNQPGDQNTWLWDYGDGNVSTDNNTDQFHTYADSGVYQVCLTVYNIVSNDTLCSDTYCGNITAGNVDTTTANCIADFYYYPVNTYDYHFYANNQGGDQNTWVWDFGDGNVSTDNNIDPFHTYADSGVYQVCLTVYNIVSNDTLCSDTYCEYITIGNGNIDTTTVNCIADFDYYPVNTLEYHFYANNQPGDQNTWLWDYGDGNVSTDNNTDQFHTYADSGVYQVCLTVYNIVSNDTLCSDTYCGNIIIADNNDTIINPVNTDTIPVDTITTNPVDSCIIDYIIPIDSAYINSFTVLDSNTVLVVWVFWQNGTEITITVEYFYIFQGNNVIYFTIYCDDGSKSLNSTTVVDVINIQYEDINDITENKINSNSSLIVYPNPVIDNLNIKANLKSGTKLTLTITNIIGQQIETYALTLSKGEHLIKVPVNNLLKGIYLINITSSDGKIKTVRKFVK